MKKETITSVNITTGKEYTKDYYFNLTQAELAEINFDIDGGFEGLIKSLDENPERSYIVKVFKTLLGKAVCEKTPDGKRIVKSDDITNEFLASDAYSQLFIKLAFADDFTPALEFLSQVIIGFDKSIVEKVKNDPEYLNKVREDPTLIDDILPAGEENA
jgi:hypothetical protein